MLVHFFSLSLQGYVPLFQSWESFYTRNVYRRIRDCWNIPIASCAGSHIDVQERVSDDYGWNFEYVLGICGMLVVGGYNVVCGMFWRKGSGVYICFMFLSPPCLPPWRLFVLYIICLCMQNVSTLLVAV